VSVSPLSATGTPAVCAQASLQSAATYLNALVFTLQSAGAAGNSWMLGATDQGAGAVLVTLYADPAATQVAEQAGPFATLGDAHAHAWQTVTASWNQVSGAVPSEPIAPFGVPQPFTGGADADVPGMSPVASCYPSVDEIGAMLHARTVDENGAELGTFTSATRPTDTQVSSLISLVAGGLDALSASLGWAGQWPDGLVGSAKDAIVLCVCWRIEAGYFPAQTQVNQSAISYYQTACQNAWQKLDTAARDWAWPDDPAGGDAHTAIFAGGWTWWDFRPIEWWITDVWSLVWWDPATETWNVPAAPVIPWGNPAQRRMAVSPDEALLRASVPVDVPAELAP